MLPNSPSPRRGDPNPRPSENGYAFAGPSGRAPLRQLPTTIANARPPPNILNRSAIPPPLNRPVAQQQQQPASTLSSPASEYSRRSGSTAGLLGPRFRSDMPVYDAEKGMDFRSSGQSLVVPSRPSGVPSSLGKASPYSSTSTLASSTSGRGSIAMSANPEYWVITPGTPGSATDDWLHNPNPVRDKRNDRGGTIFTARGMANVGCLLICFTALVSLFAGFPLFTHYVTRTPALSTFGAYNLGGVNASGQVPVMPGNFGLIDRDTPQSAFTKSSFQGDGEELQLVFSDEFNVDGRSFYPGDDPYWEAEDLHYWQTNNLEWYDPKAVTTKDGNMVITLTKEESHGLNYVGGLVSTWNKFCFTGGLLEVNAVLPGASNIRGLWPAIWAMGNLGRMGYGASLEGMWPYSYNSCDLSTLANQTLPDGTPLANTVGNNGEPLSFLPGQRLSACTCAGEDHPGPKSSDGSFVGRGAPEIDILEATISSIDGRFVGQVSQSAQWAPFNEGYKPVNDGQTIVIHEPDLAEINLFVGNHFQQTTSALVTTNNACGYEASGANACYSVYGFQYTPGVDGYITWISDDKASWTMNAGAVAPDPVSGAGQRVISEEPLYIIANLGISPNFGVIDFANLVFPARLYIDYVRVYQPKDQINIGCDPSAYPTEAYITKHIEAYTNANLTTFEQYGQAFPKNRLVDTC